MLDTTSQTGISGYVMTIITIIHLSIAELLPPLNIMLHLHIPPIILELSQLAAWWIGGLVGIATLYKFYFKYWKK